MPDLATIFCVRPLLRFGLRTSDNFCVNRIKRCISKNDLDDLLQFSHKALTLVEPTVRFFEGNA